MPKKQAPSRFSGRNRPDVLPDWSPLLAMVGTELTGWFMWMGAIDLEGATRVHVFKHHDTRANVHIGIDGRTFYYDWDGEAVGPGPYDYVELPRTRAVAGAFRRWHEMLEGEPDRDRLLSLVDDAWNAAFDGRTLPVDPRELELQRAYEIARYGVGHADAA